METELALEHYEANNVIDSDRIIVFKGDVFAMRKRCGYIEGAEAIVSDLDSEFRKYYSKPHPEYIHFIGNVVFLYMDQGKWSQAAHWAERLLYQRKVVFGDDSKTALLAEGMLLSFQSSLDRPNSLEQMENIFRRIC